MVKCCWILMGMWASVLAQAAMPVTTQSAATLQFENFATPVVLHAVGEQVYQVEASQQRVMVARRLVVRVAADFPKQRIAAAAGIDNVSALFLGHDYQYWLVALSPGVDIAEMLAAVADIPGVERVQPDLLQLRDKAGDETTDLHSSGHYQVNGLAALWQFTQGQGVKVAVIDDGFALNHPQFVQLSPTFLYDTASQQLNVAPQNSQDTHGTRVAGVLFAAHDGHGLKGLVPNAGLIGIRQPDSWTSNTLLAFQLAAMSRADVINCSWTTRLLLEPVQDVVRDLARWGRAGRGLPVVFAAGNEGRLITPHSSEAAIPEAIVVGALGLRQQRLPHSNYGPTVDFYAFGLPLDSTDIAGGYQAFGGTSLAAAIVSGLAALIIATEPDMPLSALQQRLADLLPAPMPVASSAGTPDPAVISEPAGVATAVASVSGLPEFGLSLTPLVRKYP